MVKVNRPHLFPIPQALAWSFADTSDKKVNTCLAPTSLPKDHGLHLEFQPELKRTICCMMWYSVENFWCSLLETGENKWSQDRGQEVREKVKRKEWKKIPRGKKRGCLRRGHPVLSSSASNIFEWWNTTWFYPYNHRRNPRALRESKVRRKQKVTRSIPFGY